MEETAQLTVSIFNVTPLISIDMRVNSPNSTHPVGSPEAALADNMDQFKNILGQLMWIEKALLRGIPILMENASNYDFSEILRKHHRIAKDHVVELESVFKVFRKNPETIKCEPVAKIISENELKMKQSGKGSITDAAIIETAIKVQQLQIELFENLIQQSEKMTLTTVVPILKAVKTQEESILQELESL
jgi:ferritin-like metal-binding protein YciE